MNTWLFVCCENQSIFARIHFITGFFAFESVEKSSFYGKKLENMYSLMVLAKYF